MPVEIKYTQELMGVIDLALIMAEDDQMEFITPEMVLDAMLYGNKFCEAVDATILHGDHREFQNTVLNCIYDNNTALPDGAEPMHSEQYIDLFTHAEKMAESAGKTVVDVPGVLAAMMDLPDSWAANLLEAYFGDNRVELLRRVIDISEKVDGADQDDDLRDDFFRSVFDGQL